MIISNLTPPCSCLKYVARITQWGVVGLHVIVTIHAQEIGILYNLFNDGRVEAILKSQVQVFGIVLA
jgi:hypothetical protein